MREEMKHLYQDLLLLNFRIDILNNSYFGFYGKYTYTQLLLFFRTSRNGRL